MSEALHVIRLTALAGVVVALALCAFGEVNLALDALLYAAVVAVAFALLFAIAEIVDRVLQRKRKR